MGERAALWIIIGLVCAVSAVALVRVQKVQHNQNGALHSIICFVEYREKTTLPPKQKKQAIKFWAVALNKAHLPACP